MRTPFSLVVAVVLLFTLGGCNRVIEENQDSATRLGVLRVFHTASTARSVVFLFSDAAGWTDDLSETARRLAQAGAIVLGVDLPNYQAGLRASDDGCHYLISEIEDISKRVQRQFGVTRYRTPLLVGRGEGGTLAYAALTQSPYVTVAGAVALDPVPVLETKVSLCPGATATPAGGGFTYANKTDLPGSWTYTYTTAPATAPDWAKPEQGAHISGWKRWLYGDDITYLVRPLLGSANSDPAGLDDLPLTPIPSTQDGDTLAVILSGDGGWRDIDRTIGEALAKDNIAVVGWDTLRYFWQPHPATQVAADLGRVINSYGKLWNRKRILLIGYSFGADVLPAAYNLLAPDVQARIEQISLLGLSETADFQFHVEGWLGVESADASKTLPEIAKIPKSLLQCLYGDEDGDQICTNPAFDGITRNKLSGGHHFDGSYDLLAQTIEAEWNKKKATP